MKRKSSKKARGEKPFSISREFTYSFGAKGNLRPFVEGFIGTKLHDDDAYNFNLEDSLGKKDGNTYANIQRTSPLPKGMTAPEIVNEKRLLDINSIPYKDIEALPGQDVFQRGVLKSQTR